MRKFLSILGLAVLALCFTGCPSTVSLEQPTATTPTGTYYTDANLAVIDQGILTAAQAMDGFVAWESANSAFLAKWPEIHQTAVNIQTNEATWIRNAYAARDAFAAASTAYKLSLAAGQAGTAPDHAKIDAALAALKSIADQVAQYRAAHPTS